MKQRRNTTRWLGLALACGTFTFAVSSQAGKPPKPPPTPAGPAYRIISLGNLGGSNWDTWGPVNDVGGVLGNVAYNAGGGRPAVCVVVPEPSADGPVYFRDTSPADGINDLVQILPGLRNSNNYGAWDINNAGAVAGASIVESGWDAATVWVGGVPIDLGIVADEDVEAYGINNLGLVVTGPLQWLVSFTPSYLVVPKDNSGDGVPDTWFEDLNGDGMNDLARLIAPQLGYNPRNGLYYDIFAPEGGLNDAGQVLLHRYIMVGASVQLAYRLTPDYTDADGDGNPWYADTDGDGFNDLLVELAGLGGDVTRADHINATGQVVGYSSGRAVRWDFAADGTPTITVLPLLSGRVLSMSAAAINDAGDIVGGASTRNSSTSFLFQNGKMYDLAALLVNATGWTSLGASDLNNQGVITGTGSLNGVRQGFVAIPVTQP